MDGGALGVIYLEKLTQKLILIVPRVILIKL